MSNQSELIHDVLKGMEGIGGVPSNQEFYSEFDFRVRTVLGIVTAVSNKQQGEHRTPNALDRYVFANKLNGTEETGIVDLETMKVICLCPEEQGTWLRNTLNKYRELEQENENLILEKIADNNIYQNLKVENTSLRAEIADLKGSLEASRQHVSIITSERDWQTDVVVPDLEQKLGIAQQEIERLTAGIKQLVEITGTANRSSFNQIKDAVNGAQEIAENLLDTPLPEQQQTETERENKE
jgi:hypothetical protein